jgi:GxxExxY protein
VIVERDLTERIIGAAIEVHRALGPGLLESAYEQCFCYELGLCGLKLERQLDLPLFYKDIEVSCGYRVDVIVERAVLLELKAVERLLPVHEAQLLTYLRLSGVRVGLLLNFNTSVMKQGIVRRVL